MKNALHEKKVRNFLLIWIIFLISHAFERLFSGIICIIQKIFAPLYAGIIRAGTPTEEQKAQMAAYGFSAQMTEAECVAELFKMYK